jgi:hypothetical protein
VKETRGWQRSFDEPVELPDGRKLQTLKEAIAWLAQEIPKSEHTMPKVQTAARIDRLAARQRRLRFGSLRRRRDGALREQWHRAVARLRAEARSFLRADADYATPGERHLIVSESPVCRIVF